jgi:predicted XRE-type DNA-binding protein/DNA-binding transcriptional regulator YiaG
MGPGSRSRRAIARRSLGRDDKQETMKVTRNKATKGTKVGQSVIRSLKEIRAWQRGKNTVRVVEVPGPIPPVKIKAIRKKVTKSVRVFSERFGLPAKTIQQWARCIDKLKTVDAVVSGSTNVLADLGYPGAAQRQTKLRLVHAINNIVDERPLTQAAAAVRLNISQPKVSALQNYKLDGFSVERLMTFLTALDRDVEIVIRRKPRSRPAARISVVAA